MLKRYSVFIKPLISLKCLLFHYIMKNDMNAYENTTFVCLFVCFKEELVWFIFTMMSLEVL